MRLNCCDVIWPQPPDVQDRRILPPGPTFQVQNSLRSIRIKCWWPWNLVNKNAHWYMLIWPNLFWNWPTIQDIPTSTRLWGRFCWPETTVLNHPLNSELAPENTQASCLPKRKPSSCKHPFSGANCEFWGVYLPSDYFCPATFFSVKLRPLKRRGSPCTRSKVGRVDESVGGKIQLPKRLRRLEKRNWRNGLVCKLQHCLLDLLHAKVSKLTLLILLLIHKI